MPTYVVRFKYLVVFLVLLLAFLILGLIVALPSLSDLDYVKRIALQQLEQQVGEPVQISEVRLRVFPRVQLELVNIVVGEGNSSSTLLSARRVIADIRLIPLLFRQVVLDRLIIEHPRLALHRDAAGSWIVPFLRNEVAPASGASTLTPASLMVIPAMRLTDGEFTLHDEFRPDGAMSARLSSLQADVSFDKERQGVNVRLSSAVSDTSFAGTLDVVGTITSLQLTDVTVGGTFDGVASATNMDVGKLISFFGRQPMPVKPSEGANIEAHFSLVPAAVGYSLILSQFQAELGHVSLKGQGNVDGLFESRPLFAITLSSSPITVEEILHWTPLKRLPPAVQTLVTERSLAGAVEVVKATATGALGTTPRIDLSGEFKLSQVQFSGPDGTAAKQFSGVVFLNQESLSVVDLKGGYGALRISNGRVTVSPLIMDPILKLSLKAEIAAGDLPALVSKHVDSRSFARIFKSITNVQGEIATSVEVTGPVSHPDALKIVKGEVRAHAVGLHTTFLPQPIHDLNGQIILGPAGIDVADLQVGLGKSQFTIQGSVSNDKTTALQKLAVHGRVHVVDIAPLLPHGRISSPALQGVADAAVTFSGPLAAPRIKGTFDFKETAFAVPNVFRKTIGVPAFLNFEAHLLNDSVLTIQNADLRLSQSNIVANGMVHLSGTPRLEASLRAERISLTNWAQTISLGPVREGLMDLSLKIQGEGDWRGWQVNGWMVLQDGRVLSDLFEDPLTNVSLRINLMGNKALIEQLAFKIGNSDLHIAGVIEDWRLTPSIDLHVKSSQLDLARLLPRGQPRMGRQQSPSNLPDLDVRISVRHAYYQQFLFTDLDCRLRVQNNLLQVDSLTAGTDEGHISGRLVVPFSEADVRHGSLQVSGIPVERVISFLGVKEAPLQGWLSLDAEAQQEGGFSSDLSGVRSLNDVEVLIEDGQIKKVSTISKILSLLNLPSLLRGKVNLADKGLPFDKIKVVFTIENEILTFKKIVIDGPVLEIGGAGSYRLGQDDLNVVLAVSPVASYSKLLRNAPLLGKLFVGESDGLLGALFEVKGSRQNPSVRYMPLQQLSKTLTGIPALAVNVLKNAIMLPKEMLTPTKQAR